MEGKCSQNLIHRSVNLYVSVMVVVVVECIFVFRMEEENSAEACDNAST